MAITCSFADNVNYGTEDINAIVGDLTGAGIAPFLQRDTYSTADLNVLTEAIVGCGVSLGGCLCVKSDNILKIDKGIIFFENGVRMNVDSDGYEIVAEDGVTGYVYAHFNTSLQTGKIEFNTALPENGYTVLIAEVCEDGLLKDRRTFARSKIATFGANAVHAVEFTIVENPILVHTSGSYKTLLIRRLDDVDLSKFNYVYFSFVDNRGFYDLNTGKFVVQYTVGTDGRPTGDISCNTKYLSAISEALIEVERENNSLYVKQTAQYMRDVYAEYPMSVILV